MAKKAKIPFVPTQKQREDATRFPVYELWMLRACLDMPKPRSGAEKSVWYEGLVLHTRVLREFFFLKLNEKGNRATHDTDIVAVDYFSSPASWSYTSNDLPRYLKETKERMDQTLAHLSYCRLDYVGTKKNWSAPQIRHEIGEKWLEFIAKMQSPGEPWGPWFLNQAEQFKVPITAPF